MKENIIKLNGQELNSFEIGNKAYNINKLIRLGFNVPEAYIMPICNFEKYIKTYEINQILLEKSDIKFLNNLLNQKKQFINEQFDIHFKKNIISKIPLDKIAIRSSSSVEDGNKKSWAGLFDSYLNVKKEDFSTKIISCWLSLFNERAIRYAQLNRIDWKEYKMAVLIQKMISPYCSGVVFTKNPINIDTDSMIIEANYGLGEGVVSGQSNADYYEYINSRQKIIKRIANKSSFPKSNEACLNDNQILKLVKYCKKIEKKFKFPCDIEWCFDGIDFHFLQVRPITNINEKLMVSHQSDLLTQDLVLSGVFKHSKFSNYGVSFDFPYIKYYHSTGNIYYPSHQVEEFDTLELNLNQLKEIRSFLKTELFEFENFIKKFSKDSKNLKKTKHVEDFFTHSLKAVSTIPYFICFEIVVNRMLKENSIPLDSIPSSITKTSKAFENLQQLKKKYKNEISLILKQNEKMSFALVNDLNNFSKEFGFLGMLYFKGKPWDLTDIFKMLISSNESSKLVKTKNKNNTNNELIKIASDLLKYRTEKWELMCYACSVFREFYIKNFNHIIHYDKILDLRINEVISIINGKYVPYNNRENFILKIEKNDVVLYDNIKATDNPKKIENNINFFKGITANKGFAKGRARIILNASNDKEFKVGDILVTKMSTPDFLPIMEKASAFVTEIGGVTSHASIIARELNKPCIIGVENLTTLLPNKSIIEVNATKGEIKVIE